MKRPDITIRMLRVAMVPALTIALVLTFYFSRQRLEDLELSLKERGAAFARQLALAAEFGVYSGNRDELQRLVAAVSSEEGVTAITIRDATGAELANSRWKETPAMDDKAVRTSAQQEVDHGRTLVSSSPILQNQVYLEEFFNEPMIEVDPSVTRAKVLGRVYVAMSKGALSAQRERLFIETLAITLLIFIASVFIALRMSRNVSRPIARLTEAVQKIAEGDLDTRVVPDSDGVVRALEDGVNIMARTLKSAHADLEQRVADATVEVEHRREEAERANQAKSKFLAAASHDLRQPLHALGLFVAGLQERSLPPEAHRVAQQIERSVVAMQDLLEALLDISRLDAGGVAPNVSDFSVKRLLSAMETHFASSAQAKSLAFRIVPSRAAVRSDPILLERILLNLVSNALRYTERGTVLLGCRRRGPDLLIQVWDTGVGITQPGLGHIFDEFYRVPGNKTSASQEPGLGLGLAIVDRFARLLGHTIEVRSQPGKGSMFSVRVGRAPYAAPAHEEVTGPGDAWLAGISVLVIDDDAAVRSAAATLFEGWGCEVATASDGAEARALLSRSPLSPPQLIVCDYRLSHEENGIDLLNQLRVDVADDIPAILVSADTTVEVANAAAANGYPLLHKPLRPAKLRSLALHLLTRG
jgi:signal transduction histidine kinase/CheY-like chemotaxis protein